MFSFEFEMREKALKVLIEIPGWNTLDSVSLSRELKEKVLSYLREQNLSASDSVISKSCKNAVSLSRAKKKSETSSLTVYLPRSLVNDSSSSPSSTSSVDTGNSDSDEQEHFSFNNDIVQQNALVRFDYVDEKGLTMYANFDYMKDIFSEFLNHSKSIKIYKFIDEICSYCFHSVAKLYADVPKLRRQVCSQLSCFVRDAKKRAKVRHVTITKILTETPSFFFHSNAVELAFKVDEFSSMNFDAYHSIDSPDRVLLVRDKDVLLIQRENEYLHVFISQSFALRTLDLFHSNRIMDIDEILGVLRMYCEKRQLALEIEQTEETVKTILLDRSIDLKELNGLSFIATLIKSDVSSSSDGNIDLDALLGPVYTTRGIKRKAQLVPFDSGNSESDDDSDEDDVWQTKSSSGKKKKEKKDDHSFDEELRRKFLHIKDEHHITDSAIKAMYTFFKETNQRFYSMAEIERIRKKSNEKIPLKFTKDSAYVPFEFALRVSVFVAVKFRPELLQLNQLSFRLNMDGTLMGNKHVVAISVNCVDGGPLCQTARKLVPVGIFEIQKESNELLRKTLPKDFLDSIQSVKHLNVTRKKSVAVKIRLGGDFQNSVYVFGLAGVHCNYPCVFCTQSKSYLHVTEKNTECEEEVWVGTGKNRKKEKKKIIVNPTSSYDPTRGARSLEEKRACLAKKEKDGTNNELGYQSEPLFGDLFEFHDYVIDNLHMRLRIFDIILKDILSEASRTGEYGPAHNKKLEDKVEILNKHSMSTIGKRFFFKIETENNIKTIVACGRFSGHLQDQFFVDSFPYEKIIENDTVAKNARNLVNKFKLILKIIKTEKSKRTHVLADVAKSFVKDFRQSGLRTGCTPYMHLIGTHLAEQDEHENLTAYDMQGVEKSNDLLSRLYFSSSNRAKTPLRTMVQSLYRRLEMNFTEPSERIKMTRYALKGTFDETDSEEDDDSTAVASNPFPDGNQSSQSTECYTDESEREEVDSTTEDEVFDQAPNYVAQSYPKTTSSGDRWRSFKTK